MTLALQTASTRILVACPAGTTTTAGWMYLDTHGFSEIWHMVPKPVVPTLPTEIAVEGEKFIVEAEDGAIYLSHPRWSLVGMGATIQEAKRDLRAEAQDVVQLLDGNPHAFKGPEAAAFERYVRRIA